MGRPKLGAEYKKPSDYYYPANREIAKRLVHQDKVFIASKTGVSLDYVRSWCVGRRRNAQVDELARRIVRLNIEKQRKLEKIKVSSN